MKIGGVEATAIAQRFGTPCYVHDAGIIRERHLELSSCLPKGSDIFYGVKAHANVAILQLLRRLGCGVDACSPGDLEFARAAGFSGSQISYHSHGASTNELSRALEAGATLILDSHTQIERVARLQPGARVGLRINVGIEAGFAPLVQAGARSSKFGIHDFELESALVRSRSLGLTVVGLHSHLGSDLSSPSPHLELLERLLALASHCPDIEFVDIGGGWGTPFLPTDAGNQYPPLDREARYPFAAFGRGVASLLDSFESGSPRRPRLRVEPGAYLMMEAGVLLASVTEIKEPAGIGGQRTSRFVCTDTSYNHVHSAVVHQTFHEILLARSTGQRPLEYQTVTGHLMQAGDLLARDRMLPRLEPGDLLVVLRCGAYKASRAPTFNERPRPAEVLVDGGRATLVRRRESDEDLLSHQMPASGPGAISFSIDRG